MTLHTVTIVLDMKLVITLIIVTVTEMKTMMGSMAAEFAEIEGTAVEKAIKRCMPPAMQPPHHIQVSPLDPHPHPFITRSFMLLFLPSPIILSSLPYPRY